MTDMCITQRWNNEHQKIITRVWLQGLIDGCVSFRCSMTLWHASHTHTHTHRHTTQTHTHTHTHTHPRTHWHTTTTTQPPTHAPTHPPIASSHPNTAAPSHPPAIKIQYRTRPICIFNFFKMLSGQRPPRHQKVNDLLRCHATIESTTVDGA